MSTIRFLGGGSHRVFEISGFLIFKFPHGSNGDLLVAEKRLCDHLKTAFSLPIPSYRYFSEGIPTFPRPIAGYQKLPGVVLEAYPLERPEQRLLAPQIARFLSELHSLPVEEILEDILVPFQLDKFRIQLEEMYQEIQQLVYPKLSQEEQDWTTDLFEQFIADESCWQFTPTLTHGDFDASNILYHPCRGRIVGIIDFEEAGIGDPAWDLCCLLAEFGQDFLNEVLKSYTAPMDETFRKRIAFHSKRIIFIEILYGLQYKDDDFFQHGMNRLKRAIAGEDVIGGWLTKSTSKTRYVPGFPL